MKVARAKLERTLTEVLGRDVVAGAVTVQDLRDAVGVLEIQASIAESAVGDAQRALIALDGEALLADDDPALQARIKVKRADKRRAEGDAARLAALVAALRRRADQAERGTRSAKVEQQSGEIDRACAEAMAAGVAADQAIDHAMGLIDGLLPLILGSAKRVGLRQLGDATELGHMQECNEVFLRDLLARRAAAIVRGDRPLPSVAGAMNAVTVVTRRGFASKQQEAA